MKKHFLFISIAGVIIAASYLLVGAAAPQGTKIIQAVPFTDLCKSCKEKEESAGLWARRRTPLITR